MNLFDGIRYNLKGLRLGLKTPKLLALEGQKASVVIGERQGYPVTTTINQVATESIEFLESGQADQRELQ